MSLSRRDYLKAAVATTGLAALADPVSAAETVTWESKSEWDGATSESGVVHESVANTDHDDATILKRGYPYGSFTSITPTPDAVYPLHEDSGSTANDLSGNGNDGTINGATVGQPTTP